MTSDPYTPVAFIGPHGVMLTAAQFDCFRQQRPHDAYHYAPLYAAPDPEKLLALIAVLKLDVAAAKRRAARYRKLAEERAVTKADLAAAQDALCAIRSDAMRSTTNPQAALRRIAMKVEAVIPFAPAARKAA